MNEELKNINLHKEIDLVQACISRMAHNSFLLKGWAITLLVLILTFSEKNKNPAIISLIPFISFWFLDAFFLRTEKMYREMYKWVLEKRRMEDFSLEYDLNPHRFDKQVASYSQIMFSLTLRWFYGVPILGCIFIYFFN